MRLKLIRGVLFGQQIVLQFALVGIVRWSLRFTITTVRQVQRGMQWPSPRGFAGGKGLCMAEFLDSHASLLWIPILIFLLSCFLFRRKKGALVLLSTAINIFLMFVFVVVYFGVAMAWMPLTIEYIGR